jgi:hypothetical protein
LKSHQQYELVDNLDEWGVFDIFHPEALLGFMVEQKFWGIPGEEDEPQRYSEEDWDTYIDRIAHKLGKYQAVGDDEIGEVLDI